MDRQVCFRSAYSEYLEFLPYLNPRRNRCPKWKRIIPGINSLHPGFRIGPIVLLWAKFACREAIVECLEWSEELSVGIYEMDEEHISLFALYNDVCAAVEEGRPPEETAALLRALLDQTREHFASEERLLASTGFPGFTAHADHHRDLDTVFRKYMAQFERPELGSSATLLGFLRPWLTMHVQEDDREYGAWLKSQGVASGPVGRFVS
jgi:hemerythrin